MVRINNFENPYLTEIERMKLRIAELEYEGTHMREHYESNIVNLLNVETQLHDLLDAMRPFLDLLPRMDYMPPSARFSLVADAEGEISYGDFLYVSNVYNEITKGTNSFGEIASGPDGEAEKTIVD